MEAAAEWIATNVKEFQLVKLKNFAETWTDKDGKLGSELNDTLLTIIQAIVKKIDFRRILWDDIIAVGLRESRFSRKYEPRKIKIS